MAPEQEPVTLPTADEAMAIIQFAVGEWAHWLRRALALTFALELGNRGGNRSYKATLRDAIDWLDPDEETAAMPTDSMDERSAEGVACRLRALAERTDNERRGELYAMAAVVIAGQQQDKERQP